MKYGKVFQRVWKLVWSYRVLWIFGAILALTTVNGFYVGYDWDRDQSGRGIAIKVTDDNTLYLPGQGLIVDLTGSDGVSVSLADESLRQDWHEIEYLFTDVIPLDVRAVVLTFLLVLASMLLVGIVARYVTEAAMIRMVHETEKTGEKVTLIRGLRLGFSRSAWRLFLIDLVIRLPVNCIFVALFILTFTPLWLWTTGSTIAGIVGTLFTTGFLLLAILLLVIVNAVLSLVIQVIRRACGIEGLGVFASIRQGSSIVKGHLKETVVVWLVWLGLRLGWMIVTVPVLIVIFPLILLFILMGSVLGGISALMIGSLLQFVLTGPFPWIVGALIGLPILLLVMLAPMLFLAGLVEVGKSSLWTLSYMDLRALEGVETARGSAPEASSLRAAPAA